MQRTRVGSAPAVQVAEVGLRADPGTAELEGNEPRQKGRWIKLTDHAFDVA